MMLLIFPMIDDGQEQGDLRQGRKPTSGEETVKEWDRSTEPLSLRMHLFLPIPLPLPLPSRYAIVTSVAGHTQVGKAEGSIHPH